MGNPITASSALPGISAPRSAGPAVGDLPPGGQQPAAAGAPQQRVPDYDAGVPPTSGSGESKQAGVSDSLAAGEGRAQRLLDRSGIAIGSGENKSLAEPNEDAAPPRVKNLERGISEGAIKEEQLTRDEWLALLREDGMLARHAPRLLASRERMGGIHGNTTVGFFAANTALRQNGLALRHMSMDVRRNLELCKIALEQDGRALKFVASELRNDWLLCLAACQQNRHAIKFVPEGVRQSPEFREAWSKVDWLQMSEQQALDTLQTSRELPESLRSAIADPGAATCASLQSQKVWFEIIRKDPELHAHAPREIQGDAEIQTLLVLKNPQDHLSKLDSTDPLPWYAGMVRGSQELRLAYRDSCREHLLKNPPPDQAGWNSIRTASTGEFHSGESGAELDPKLANQLWFLECRGLSESQIATRISTSTSYLPPMEVVMSELRPESEDLLMAIVKKDPTQFSKLPQEMLADGGYMRSFDSSDWRGIVKSDGAWLRYTPEKLKTLEVCRAAMESNPGEAIKHVPEGLRGQIPRPSLFGRWIGKGPGDRAGGDESGGGRGVADRSSSSASSSSSSSAFLRRESKAPESKGGAGVPPHHQAEPGRKQSIFSRLLNSDKRPEK